MKQKSRKNFTWGILMGALLIGSAGIGEAQLKPMVDEHIPVYHATIPVAGKVSVIGSNTMKTILEKWQDKLQEVHPGLVMSLQTEGSSTGAEALVSGKVQIAAMSRQLTPEEIDRFTKTLGYPPIAVPVAVDALAVFVHNENPIDQVTLQQLDAVFSKERRRGGMDSLDRWEQLGVPGSRGREPIHIHVRDSVSGTHQFFKELVYLGGNDKESAIIEPGAASVVSAIMIDPHAIGYSGIGYRTSKVKPLRIASKEGEAFVEATFETATNGTYPLRRLLYLYVSQPSQGERSPVVSEIIKFAVSQSGQQAVVKAGFYPLPVKDLIELSASWSGLNKAAAMKGIEQTTN
ncbi:MAG: phosphate ABC transporter substrate-binding protein [Nitrospirales bacterium]|nr:phosphate ABC transporter substrate-binding protein [Nitrospirales bacterium]